MYQMCKNIPISTCNTHVNNISKLCKICFIYNYYYVYSIISNDRFNIFNDMEDLFMHKMTVYILYYSVIFHCSLMLHLIKYHKMCVAHIYI